jgi:SAM-dependent methyltransferase
MTQFSTPNAPQFDLDYAIEEDIPPAAKRDSQFIFARAPQLVTEKATQGAGGKVLDVGCAFGEQLALLRARGWESWGLDASFDLAHYCRSRFAGEQAPPVVCGTAEALPFRDASLDRIVCQGSLDHFARPRAFLSEAARVLKPDGRAVIALSNYDSLSCRLGRSLYRLRQAWGRPVLPGRPYWEIPSNHTFRGAAKTLSRLAEPHLELVECRGVSLLWLFPRWTQLVELLPRPLARSAMTALDRIAYRLPAAADMLVSVWQPRRGRDAGR